MQHLFLHVPEDRGLLGWTLIQQNYPSDRTIGFSGDPDPLAWFSARPPAFKQRYELVHGHFPYGVHQGLTRYLYFTFLREPVARHFSDFDFLRRYDKHPMHAEIVSGRITPEDWASVFEQYPEFRDRMTRFISGDGDSSIPDRLSLETAKLHLRREFAPVGLADRFDESVLVLAKRLGWRSIFYLRRNVSVARTEPTTPMRETARGALRLDVELYEFAQRLFEEAPELHDPRFQEALREYRKVQGWLDTHVANNPADLYLVGDTLPPLSTLVREHRSTPALDRYFDWPSRQAA